MSSTNDLAILGFGINPAGMEPGRKAVHSALDGIQTKATSVIANIQKLAKQANDALNLVNGGSTGASRIEADAIRTQNRITQITAQEQQRRESDELRHQQRIAEIQSRNASVISANLSRQTTQIVAEQTRRESAEQKSQQRQIEIATRGGDQRATIQARRISQLEVIQAREEAAELRHKQRMAEIVERENARGKNNATNNSGSNVLLGGAALSATVTAPIIGLAQQAVQSFVELDSAKRSLAAVSGGAEQASKQLDRLREIAKLPGIDFQGAIQGATRLQAVGFSASEAERTLKAFANAVALTGGGAAQLQSVTIQLGQLASKGKVLGQDLRPIIESAPIVGRVLKQAFGTVDSEAISNQLQKAGKSSKQFVTELLTELEKLPTVVGGPKEVLENFGISVSVALSKLGEAIIRLLGPALQFVADKIEKFGEAFGNLPESVQATIVVLGALAAAIGPIVLEIVSNVVGIVFSRSSLNPTVSSSR